MAACVKKAPKKLSTSEKIDRVVTNRILGLPIFVIVMSLVYFISISTVGINATNWVNDNLFDKGFHVLGIGDAEYSQAKDDFDSSNNGSSDANLTDSARRAQDSIAKYQHPIATPQRKNTSIPLMH